MSNDKARIRALNDDLRRHLLEHFPITLRRNQPRRDNFGIPRVRSA